MNYRKATIWDAVRIVEMWNEMISEVPYLKDTNADPERFYFHILGRIKDPNHSVIVAESNKEIVGFITGYMTKADYSDKLVGFCDNAFVDKKYMGGKVYFDLIAQIYESGVKAGAQEVKFQQKYSPMLLKVWEGRNLNRDIWFSRWR